VTVEQDQTHSNPVNINVGNTRQVRLPLFAVSSLSLFFSVSLFLVYHHVFSYDGESRKNEIDTVPSVGGKLLVS
jgi:hypothetical protein